MTAADDAKNLHGYASRYSRICGTSNRCWRRRGSTMWRWSAGIDAPGRQDGFAWCDLGCGQGVTAAILAATHPAGEFHGIDAMPAHIDHARRLAAEAAIPNVAFPRRRFCRGHRSRPLPQFDYIVAHGVYTWIDREAQRALRRFIDRPPQTGRPRLSRLQRDAGLGARSAVPTPGARAWPDLSRRQCRSLCRRRRHRAALLPSLAFRHWRRASPSRNCRSGRKIMRRPISSTNSCPPHGSRFMSPRSEAAMAAIGLEPVGSATLSENFDWHGVGRKGPRRCSRPLLTRRRPRAGPRLLSRSALSPRRLRPRQPAARSRRAGRPPSMRAPSHWPGPLGDPLYDGHPCRPLCL